MIAVHFYRSETWGLLEASYLFSPESEHIRSNTVPALHDSDWFGMNLQKYPDKLVSHLVPPQWRPMAPVTIRRSDARVGRCPPMA